MANIVVLTDAERAIRPPAIRNRFTVWLEFSLTLNRTLTFRRWFESLEARDRYILQMPKHATVTKIGQEP